jgi:glycosyltransferase involved in cell wall biosynthesis
MRIAIDLQGAQTESRFRGIGRYSLSLALAIARERGEHEIIIVLSGLFPESIETIRAQFEDLLPQENIHIWEAPGPTRWIHPVNQWRRDVAERLREAFLQSLRPDVVLVTSLFEGVGDDAVTSIGVSSCNFPTATILYDLIPLLKPETFFFGKPILREHYFNKIHSLNKSDLLLAISQSAEQEAISHLHFSPEKIVNISGAYDTSFQKQPISEKVKADLFRKLGIQKPFILYTGGADDRKNLIPLIEAFSRLPQHILDAHQLLFVGNMPKDSIENFYLHAKQCAINQNQFIVAGYVNDQELLALYNSCKLFVFPSLHEGFGIPPLEAMSCGAVVIGSNATSLPEVIGHPQALFDPQSIESISAKILDALTNENLRTTLLSHGEKQCKLFSWQASAKKAITALERLHYLHPDDKIVPAATTQTQALIESIAKIDNPMKDPLSLALLAKCIYQNQPRQFNQKYLFIDISELIHRDAKTGIQRVVKAILKSILQSPPPYYRVIPVYATSDRIGYRMASCFSKGFTANWNSNPDEDDFIDFKAGDIFIGLDFQTIIIPKQRFFLQQMRAHGVQIKFVVYDLLPVLMSKFFPPQSKPFFLEWLKVVSESDEAICISESVAKELQEWTTRNCKPSLRPLKITHFSLGADFEPQQLAQDQSDLKSRDSLICENVRSYPTFLMVGTIEPRKGHEQVLEAFSLLWKAGYKVNLLFVGKRGWHVDTLVERLQSHEQLGNHLVWLQDLDDAGLKQVYLTSQCLIAASYGEGFGLPLIEAAHYGLPILARDIPVFKEVAKNYATYFTAKTASALKDQIIDWLNCYENGSAIPQSADLPFLSWEQSAAQLLSLVTQKSKAPSPS